MRKVTVFNREGLSITLKSVNETARCLGTTDTTIRTRIRDGNWIQRKGLCAVKVRYANEAD